MFGSNVRGAKATMWKFAGVELLGVKHGHHLILSDL